jgi:hypothetical protein
VAFEDAVGDRLRETASRARDPGCNRLAQDQKVRFEFFAAGVASGAGADRVRLVEDEQTAMLAGEFAQGLVKAGGGVDDAHVGEHRLRQDACDVAVRQRLFESGEVVEFDNPRG